MPETKAIDLVCPACGVSMAGLDPFGHSLLHWRENIGPERWHKDARTQQEQCRAGGITREAYDAWLREARE